MFTILVIYAVWCLATNKYATLQEHVPWRRPFIRLYLFLDKFVLSTICGVKRVLHLSLPPKAYDNGRGKCWAFSHHFLLFPGFSMPFVAERDGLHQQMGVDADEIFAASASVLFYIPVIREVVMALGGRKATKSVVEGMRVFGVVPGGVKEMINQGIGVDEIYLRTGFLRMAFRKRLDVVPGYMFDETTVYTPIIGPRFIKRIQDYAEGTFGVGLCLWKGRWGVPFNPIPNPGRYVHGVGRILEYDSVKHLKEDEAVGKWLEEVTAEIKRLFAELQEKEGRRRDVELRVTVLQSRRTKAAKKKNI